ncbi:MAG: hypothetical protein FWC43_07800 [Planctomycetaceae bacterium]|nr:hypothetical protein [Planctomycetaceae bacterium]
MKILVQTPPTMKIKDRIKEFKRVRASSLTAHPKNWRTHPEKQAAALRGILTEIGYADALLVREMPDGTLQLVDGHLRAETTPDQEVPILVLDLDDAETEKLLAVFDPISAMASSNSELLDELVRSIETQDESLRNLLDELHTPAVNSEDQKEIHLPTLFQLLVDCEDEEQQKELYEELVDRGVKLKILNL